MLGNVGFLIHKRFMQWIETPSFAVEEKAGKFRDYEHLTNQFSINIR